MRHRQARPSRQPIHVMRTPRTILLALLLCMMVAGFVFASQQLWQWAQKPSSFPIRAVRVTGQLAHVTPDQIQKIMAADLSGGFFSLHLNTAKQAILALPWVDRVSFRRVWPAQLNVHLTEEQPIARFGKTGVLNADGHVFYPAVQTIPTDLPIFYGQEEQISLLMSFYQALNKLSNRLNLSVISLHVSNAQSWRLRLSNQISVVLGQTDHALDRFQRFVVAYPKITTASKRPIKSVDLRYPDGVAVQY